MEVSRSHTVAVRDLPVEPETQIGPTNFYLSRPGFFPGGVGVAACWAGGAARIADLTRRPTARSGRGRATSTGPDAHPPGRRRGRSHDGRPGPGALCWRSPTPIWLEVQALSTEARAVVAGAVHGVLSEAQRVAGPAGLAFDEDLTRAVHDLQLYVLQQNADADELFLGGLSR